MWFLTLILGAAAFAADSDESTVKPTYKELRMKVFIEPDYPKEMKAFNFEADCRLRIEVDEEGEVTSARVEESCPEPFHDGLIETAQRWKFYPMMVNDEPIKTEMQYPVMYRSSGHPGSLENLTADVSCHVQLSEGGPAEFSECPRKFKRRVKRAESLWDDLAQEGHAAVELHYQRADCPEPRGLEPVDGVICLSPLP